MRCATLFLLPLLLVLMGWSFARYFYNPTSPSQLLTPAWLPPKQSILVNEKTQIGGVSTKKWIEKMPMYEEMFNVDYVDTTADKDYYGFDQEVFEYSSQQIDKYPYNLGSYQFFEMDEQRHKYKIMTFANLTSPYSTELFP